MYAGPCRRHEYHDYDALEAGREPVDELRKDPTRGHWILIRPKAKPSRQTDWPYCPGAEHLTAPAITAYRPEGSTANGPGWTVRVVPEPDAYFRIEWELVREGVGMFDMINPRGGSELGGGAPPPRRHAGEHGARRDRVGAVDVPRPAPGPEARRTDPRHPRVAPPQEARRGDPPSVLPHHCDSHRLRRDTARSPRGARILSVQAPLPLLRHPSPGDRRRGAGGAPQQG